MGSSVSKNAKKEKKLKNVSESKSIHSQNRDGLTTRTIVDTGLIKRTIVDESLIKEAILEKALLNVKSEKEPINVYPFYRNFINTVGDTKELKNRFEFALPKRDCTVNEYFSYIICTGWFELISRSIGDIVHSELDKKLNSNKLYMNIPLYRSNQDTKILYEKIRSLDRFYKSSEFKKSHFGIFASRMVYRPFVTKNVTDNNDDAMIKVEICLPQELTQESTQESTQDTDENTTEFYKVTSKIKMHNEHVEKATILTYSSLALSKNDVLKLVKSNSNVYIEITISGIAVKFPDNKEELIEYRLCPKLSIIAVNECALGGGQYNRTEIEFLELMTRFKVKPNIFQQIEDNTPQEVGELGC